MAPIEYLVQINAPAIITVDGDSASAHPRDVRGGGTMTEIAGKELTDSELDRMTEVFVFDHSEQRQTFSEQYSDVIEACFDDVDHWEQEREGT